MNDFRILAAAPRRCCGCGAGRVLHGLAAFDALEPFRQAVRYFCAGCWDTFWAGQDLAIEVALARELGGAYAAPNIGHVDISNRA